MTTLAASSLPATLEAPGPAEPRRRRGQLQLRLTFSGLLCAGVVVLIGLAALQSEANLLFLLFGITIGAFVVNFIFAARSVAKIRVERIAPAAVVAGRGFSITYVLRNRRTRGWAWSLVVTETPPSDWRYPWPRGFVPVIGPRQEQRIELTAICPRRGRIRLPGIRVLSRFPFGLFSCAVDLEARAELVVYPAVGRFRRNPWTDRRYGTGSGNRPRAQHQGQDEFFGVREYREGDNYRWIHWRRSAHTGQLVVREMMPLRQTQLLVILDPWPDHPTTPPGGSATNDLAAERLISAAATAICDGIDRGHRVGLICRASVPVVMAPAGGRPQQQRLLHRLATLAPGGDERLDQLVSRVRWSNTWHARCMIGATRLDEVHERLARVLAGRAEATVVLCPESENFDALFDLTDQASPSRRGR